jgi:release factor glutamine methyltransferase
MGREDFGQWYAKARAAAVQHQVPPYELDWLIQTLFGVDKLHLRLNFAPSIQEMEQLHTLWEQRIRQRIPVQYLAGKTLWRGLELAVNSAVLIPRPETELLIDVVDALLPANSRLRSGIWLDMGTGSGAIAIGLRQILPHAQIHAVDISASALAIAKLNAEKYNSSITFHQSDWFTAIPHLKGKVAGVVSNPPYIPTAEIDTLAEEVKCHEPPIALDGGSSGLTAIQFLLKEIPHFLIPNGIFVIEVMAGQAKAVVQLLAEAGNFQQIQIHRDYAGHERFISGKSLPRFLG